MTPISAIPNILLTRGFVVGDLINSRINSSFVFVAALAIFIYEYERPSSYGELAYDSLHKPNENESASRTATVVRDVDMLSLIYCRRSRLSKCALYAYSISSQVRIHQSQFFNSQQQKSRMSVTPIDLNANYSTLRMAEYDKILAAI